MDLFQETLQRLSKKILGAAAYKKDVAETLSAILSITILEDQIIIKNNTVFIRVSPTVRTALFLKKSAVLDVLKKHNITFIG